MDDHISKLKRAVKPTTDRIRELSVKKRQLAAVVSKIMGDNDIDSLEPNVGGKVVGKISRVFTKRANPTVKSFERAVLETLLDGDSERLKKLKKSALGFDKPSTATLRRTKVPRK